MIPHATRWSDAVEIDLPLRGEWTAINSPGSKIPSHGTDMLGQRYAFDFVRTHPSGKGMRFYKRSVARYLLLGARLEDCFGWGQPIYAPLPGTVVEAVDGWPERDPVHLLRDIATVLKHGFTFDPDKTDLKSVVGNHIIIETEHGYAFFAHAQTGSVAVAIGDEVAAGQPIARVGHSGNSTAPHLHFQLMDSQDLRVAQGIPCSFRDYETFREGVWQPVEQSVPLSEERIRKL